jgi:hypothetical protein
MGNQSKNVVSRLSKVNLHVRWYIIAATIILAPVIVFAQTSSSDDSKFTAAEQAMARKLVKYGGIYQLDGDGHIIRLVLDRTGCSEEILKDVSTLPYLKRLSMDRGGVTDEGLKHVVKCTGLQNVGLTNTNVTDAGLKLLQQIPSLRNVWIVEGEKLTAAGVAALQEALPNAHIHFYRNNYHEMVVKAIDRYQVLPDADAKTPLRPQVVLSWRNVARDQEGEVVLVVWPHNGRPAAMASIFPWQGNMSHKFDSLSRDSKVIARGDDKVIWSPAAAGVEFKDVPGSAKPAKTPGERLQQMKAIAERFHARMTGQMVDNSDQEELRLLPKPLYQYELKDPNDDKNANPKVHEGALFGYATGTDPEVVLLLEAVGSAGPDAWQYALVRTIRRGLKVKPSLVPFWLSTWGIQGRRPRPGSRMGAYVVIL